MHEAVCSVSTQVRVNLFTGLSLQSHDCITSCTVVRTQGCTKTVKLESKRFGSRNCSTPEKRFGSCKPQFILQSSCKALFKLKAAADATLLDGEIVALQSELGALSKRQLHMDIMREVEGKFCATAKAELEQGNSEVQNARDTLREHHVALFIQQLAAPDVYMSSGGTGSSACWNSRNDRKYFLQKKNGGTFPLA